MSNPSTLFLYLFTNLWLGIYLMPNNTLYMGLQRRTRLLTYRTLQCSMGEKGINKCDKIFQLLGLYIFSYASFGFSEHSVVFIFKTKVTSQLSVKINCSFFMSPSVRKEVNNNWNLKLLRSAFKVTLSGKKHFKLGCLL